MFSRSEFKQHLANVKNHGFAIICEDCGKPYNSRTALKYHMSTVHNKGVEVFCCITCGKNYPSKTHLIKHMKIHIDQEWKTINTIHVLEKKTTLCLTSEEIKTVLSKYTIVEKTWYRISNDGYEKANPCKGKKYWMSHSFISYVYGDILVNVVLF